MLDFDHICKRSKPSVAGMIYPFGGSHVQKFYWGTAETLVPVYTKIADAVSKHPHVDTVVNFASFRSVYESTMELFKFPQLKTIGAARRALPSPPPLGSRLFWSRFTPRDGSSRPWPNVRPRTPPVPSRSPAIIAEGVPEQKTRLLIKKAAELGVTIIGPATVRPAR